LHGRRLSMPIFADDRMFSSVQKLKSTYSFSISKAYLQVIHEVGRCAVVFLLLTAKTQLVNASSTVLMPGPAVGAFDNANSSLS